jgi:hypothetical protein
MIFQRINFDRKYLNPDPIPGKIYVVTGGNLTKIKNSINNTWIEKDIPYNYEYNFTDVYPFVNRYGYIYDLESQINTLTW